MAGRGGSYIEHDGYTYRTLDGASQQGGIGVHGWSGCQCTDTNHNGDCPDNYLPLPAGWELAPNDAASIGVIAGNGWSTACLVLADGTAWKSASEDYFRGDRCGSSTANYLATSGGTYTVVNCAKRVLARCG